MTSADLFVALAPVVQAFEEDLLGRALREAVP